MSTIEAWCKSNFIGDRSSFNSPYYNTQAKKSLANLDFSSKEKFSEFFTKFNSHKMKKFAEKPHKIKKKRKDQASFTKFYSWSFKLSPKI